MLTEFKILPTNNTPEIIFNQNGTLFIGGRSIRANMTEFNQPIEEWINEYLNDPAEVTCLNINLEYLNTNNLKFYITLIKKASLLKLKNKKIIVNWFYEEGDLDILEKGESVSSITGMPFNYIVCK